CIHEGCYLTALIVHQEFRDHHGFPWPELLHCKEDYACRYDGCKELLNHEAKDKDEGYYEHHEEILLLILCPCLVLMVHYDFPPLTCRDGSYEGVVRVLYVRVYEYVLEPFTWQQLGHCLCKHGFTHTRLTY